MDWWWKNACEIASLGMGEDGKSIHSAFIYARTRERRAVFRKACAFSGKGHDRDVCLLHHPHLLAYSLQIGRL